MLVADGGAHPEGNGYIRKIGIDGAMLWQSPVLSWPHSARQIGNDLLISETGTNRVILMAPDASILWSTDDVSPLSDGSSLDYPNDAQWLDGNILITERENHRVIELTSSGKIVWQYGVTGEQGDAPGFLAGPHNGKRLENGDTLICDSGNDRVLEVSPEGKVVWQYSDGLDWPRNADLLEKDHVLIVSSANGIVVEVTREGNTVWRVEGLDMPYDADRLADGRTIVSAYGAIYWFSPDGSVDSCYPEEKCQKFDTGETSWQSP